MHLLPLLVSLFPQEGSRIREPGRLFACTTGDTFTPLAARINARGWRPRASLQGINLILLSSIGTLPLCLSCWLSLCSTHSWQGLRWRGTGRTICMQKIKIWSFCQNRLEVQDKCGDCVCFLCSFTKICPIFSFVKRKTPPFNFQTIIITSAATGIFKDTLVKCWDFKHSFLST